MNKYFDDKPKAHIDENTSALLCLQEMLKNNPKLYDECISTVGFAYGFSQLANRAIHFDYLLSKGVIPKDYLSINTKKAFEV